MNKLNIVFMGTPTFAVSALTAIAGTHNVIAVYTKQPKPTGRKRIITKSAVHIKAEELNIPVKTPKNFKTEDVVKELATLKPDIIVVCAYGLILPQSLLDIAPCINIHASLLPSLRGANPIQRAVINGDKKTGITIMKMDAGLDTGDMLLKGETGININTTYGDLLNILSDMGANLILKYLENKDNITATKQGDNFTLAPKLKNDELLIDWNLPAFSIHKKICGMFPTPVAKTFHGKTELKIIKSEMTEIIANSELAGTLYDDKLAVICGDNKVIKILELQKVGGKPMMAKDFLNGYKLKKGDRLGEF